MIKNHLKGRVLLTILTFASFIISLSSFTVTWFVNNCSVDEGNGINGKVGLRSYFYDGDGSEAKPFEIVYPQHFYNLTRLQNLGIFNKKYHFVIGHNFDTHNPSSFKCINRFDANGEPIYEDFLDMSYLNADSVLPIGGEGAPFYGDFNGRKLPVKNLHVQGYPEDIGIFGYIANSGSVTGLIAENLIVESLGYTSEVRDPVNVLFSADIDDIFDEGSHYFVDEASLAFKKHDGSTYQMKQKNGLDSETIINLNSQDNMILDDDTYYYDGYFLPTFPSSSPERPKFDYSWKFSTTLFEERMVNGEKRAYINLSALKDNEEFNSGKNMLIDTRISLVANMTIKGYTYSRVMQTYLCEIYSNSSTWEEENYSLRLFCDYTMDYENDHKTNYHHGNNIGYLAGHVDGTITESYVYNGEFRFNDSEYTHIDTETETGLIGEIGSNVINNIDPNLGIKIKGETGVMNLTKIYNSIRSNAKVGDKVEATQMYDTSRAKIKYISYNNYRNNETFENYAKFLRHDDSSTNLRYITKVTDSDNKITGNNQTWSVTEKDLDEANSVDFIFNQVISDEPEVNRGLGVFRLTTASMDNYQAALENWSTYYGNLIGSSRIINGKPLTKIYYSTAEFDWEKEDVKLGWEASGGHNAPMMMDSLPDYSDIDTFRYPYNRDFNYCFEMDLSQIALAGNNDFFYNTDSAFLQNYLKSQLIDKYGSSIEPGEPRFGFMFRSSENEILNSLSSYMPVSVPKNKFKYTSDDIDYYYPERTIVFHIDNPNGANVSVVGASTSSDISIYRLDNVNDSKGTITQVYSMRCKTYPNNTGNRDKLRGFKYDLSDHGHTSDVTFNYPDYQSSNNALFAHIFKLPAGDYCIGATSNTNNSSGGTANIFFLAVQGQTDGTLGTEDYAAIGSAITNVDFLISAPSISKVIEEAYISFKGEFNSKEGTFAVNFASYIELVFLEDENSIVRYLLIYSYGSTPRYLVNGTLYTAPSVLYKGGA